MQVNFRQRVLMKLVHFRKPLITRYYTLENLLQTSWPWIGGNHGVPVCCGGYMVGILTVFWPATGGWMVDILTLFWPAG
jgi:hypothetical protein